MQRVLLVLAAAAASAGIAVTASSGQTSSAGKTIAVYSTARDFHVVTVDLPPKAPKSNPNQISTGDMIFQTIKLHNKAGEQIGTEYDEITFFTPSSNMNSTDLVHGTIVLADGRIFTVGLHGPQLNLDDTDAVIGGTGAYAGARGTLTSAGADEDLIHLLP